MTCNYNDDLREWKVKKTIGSSSGNGMSECEMNFRKDEDKERCSVTFHRQSSSTFFVPSITGIFTTILHIQLVYNQGVGGSPLLQGVLLPMGENS